MTVWSAVTSPAPPCGSLIPEQVIAIRQARSARLGATQNSKPKTQNAKLIARSCVRGGYGRSWLLVSPDRAAPARSARHRRGCRHSNDIRRHLLPRRYSGPGSSYGPCSASRPGYASIRNSRGQRSQSPFPQLPAALRVLGGHIDQRSQPLRCRRRRPRYGPPCPGWRNSK